LVRALLDRLRACKPAERHSDTEAARERDRRRESARASADGALEGSGAGHVCPHTATLLYAAEAEQLLRMRSHY
jgi:glycine/D-amino acid oxidase-like deaminating enzyme